MANQQYELHRTLLGNDFILVSHKDISESSGRNTANRQLRLVPHNFDWDHRFVTVPRTSNIVIGSGNDVVFGARLKDLWSYGTITSTDVAINLTNEAIARFNGKLRKHKADLGVTLASWRQASNMIHGRSEQIADILDRRIRVVQKLSAKERGRIWRKGTADAFLEGEFGWVPLMQDIQNSLGALGRTPVQPEWVSVTARTVNVQQFKDRDPSHTVWFTRDHLEQWRVRISARADLESENVWLLNRLGLLNLPGVAWDLVPWSFVANMFGNFGQMINSLSDHIGVSLGNASTTTSLYAEIGQLAHGNPAFGIAHMQAWNQQFARYKRRTLGVPTPKFMFRVPELNFELLAITASLVVQRIGKLERLLRPLKQALRDRDIPTV
jgi:hypothetical protein